MKEGRGVRTRLYRKEKEKEKEKNYIYIYIYIYTHIIYIYISKKERNVYTIYVFLYRQKITNNLDNNKIERGSLCLCHHLSIQIFLKVHLLVRICHEIQRRQCPESGDNIYATESVD